MLQNQEKVYVSNFSKSGADTLVAPTITMNDVNSLKDKADLLFNVLNRIPETDSNRRTKAEADYNNAEQAYLDLLKKLNSSVTYNKTGATKNQSATLLKLRNKGIKSIDSASDNLEQKEESEEKKADVKSTTAEDSIKKENKINHDMVVYGSTVGATILGGVAGYFIGAIRRIYICSYN
jgi:hypothetical protein